MVHGRYLPSYTYHAWAFDVTIIGLPFLGILQLLWVPVTERKARFYIIGFHLLAIISFMFVISYDSIFIFMWLLLIMASDAYLGRRAAWASMAAFLGSMTLWWRLNTGNVPQAGLIFTLLFILALFICVVALVVSRVRVISEERGFELERSREKERLERERLVALINSMGDAVVAVNEAGKVSIYNAAAASLLDTNTNLVGQSLMSVLHLQDAKSQPVDLPSLLLGLQRNMARSDLRHRFGNGEAINLYLNISPIHLGFQKPGDRGYILVLRDITKEKSLEQERDEFISVASHELRTPIAIAEGSLSNVMALKARGANEQTIDQSIKAAHDQVVLLAKMANDLATLSRAERGTEDIETETIDVHALFHKLHDDYEQQAKAKGLTLVTRLKDDVQPVQSSPVYLQEILQNLITNAIKYTKHGSVILAAGTDSDGCIVFTVEDTGIGMSKSDQKHLFEKFWRSEDYRTRESSGTGLGLYLVRKLAEQLGGKVSAESQLDGGSTFTVTIPPFAKGETLAAQAQASTSGDQPAAPLS